MADSLITQVSRDGTPARAPSPPPPKKKKGFFARLFPCCTGSTHDLAPSSTLPNPTAVVSEEEALLPVMQAQDVGKKCLVLDLDETLVHSSFKAIPNADFIIPVEIDDQIHQVYVVKRPGVDQFMKKMGEWFEVVVFTASLAKYADPVLDLLDIHKAVRYRLFREACCNHKGNYVKDLSKLGRPLQHIIIIDNSPASYMFHPENAIPIDSWFDDMSDTELLDLIPFLEELTKVDDVCSVLDSHRG